MFIALLANISPKSSFALGPVEAFGPWLQRQLPLHIKPRCLYDYKCYNNYNSRYSCGTAQWTRFKAVDCTPPQLRPMLLVDFFGTLEIVFFCSWVPTPAGATRRGLKKRCAIGRNARINHEGAPKYHTGSSVLKVMFLVFVCILFVIYFSSYFISILPRWRTEEREFAADRISRLQK